jgi:anti-sigma regulatory factor (Ser/Thr protein kinase)
MADICTIPISSGDSSQIGYARRQASSLAAAMEFGEVRQGEISIIVAEAARNIATHAQTGQLILNPWTFQKRSGIDVFALDKGPGIRDVARSLEDGYSTRGTPGNGMGAISRLAGILQIYTAPGHGTALFARVYHDSSAEEIDPGFYSFGGISIPLAGETVCGDAWSVIDSPTRSVCIMADGLGHGPLAAEAASEAIQVFHAEVHREPERILLDIHKALAKTRGAAVAIAEVLHDKSLVNYAGAGNIVGTTLAAGKTRSMVSLDGTVGHSVARFRQFAYPWESNAALIMHSDGLSARWNLDQYPGLASRHPALIAAVLYRDFARKRDDASILVSRLRPL